MKPESTPTVLDNMETTFTTEFIRSHVDRISSGPWAEYSHPSSGSFIGPIKLAPISEQVSQGADGDPDWAELAQYRQNVNFMANAPEYIRYLLMMLDQKDNRCASCGAPKDPFLFVPEDHVPIRKQCLYTREA